ncbi:hypothetical protein PR048_032678 [Dryococelus australis]|uniref:Uncharacterized protein n=1 Tax=Dryococelus australis TaxID=614101 RepID=A0ABQ9G5V4_9NEOP|nr:hypothetical protein PR048_032678 [Dryococelus australis]
MRSLGHTLRMFCHRARMFCHRAQQIWRGSVLEPPPPVRQKCLTPRRGQPPRTWKLQLHIASLCSRDGGYSPSTKANRVRILEVSPGRCRCPTGFLGVLPFSPALELQRCSIFASYYLLRFTPLPARQGDILAGSQSQVRSFRRSSRRRQQCCQQLENDEQQPTATRRTSLAGEQSARSGHDTPACSPPPIDPSNIIVQNVSLSEMRGSLHPLCFLYHLQPRMCFQLAGALAQLGAPLHHSYSPLSSTKAKITASAPLSKPAALPPQAFIMQTLQSPARYSQREVTTSPPPMPEQ